MSLERPLALAYVLLLLAGLSAAGWWAWRQVTHVEEFAQASDSFGYLQTAQDIRAGKAPHGGQMFTAEAAHVRGLIEHLKKQGIPAEKWESAVAPAAYHYVERSEKIVNQYPPGVGLLLALLPEGRALAGLYRLTLAVISAAGVLVAVWTVVRAGQLKMLAPLPAAGVLFLGLHLALNLLGTTVSYSVDFFVLAALPALGLIFLAQQRGDSPRWWEIVAALLAGGCVGYAMLMRIPNVLLLPGFVALLWPPARRVRAALPLLVFALGVLAAGVVPLLVHQYRLTGSLLVSTYARADTAPPTFDVLEKMFAHYFAGEGALVNWMFYAALAGAGLALAALWPGRTSATRRWALGAMLLWLVPLAYFLTHPIATPYYMFPPTLAAVLALGLAAATPRSDASAADAPSGQMLLLGAALLPLLLHLALAFTPPAYIFGGPDTERKLAVPAELREPNAWVYASRLSGTLWNTHGIYALDLAKADPATQGETFLYAAKSGGRQYIVDDGALAETRSGQRVKVDGPLVQIALKLGGRKEKIGTFDAQPVYRISF